MIQFSDIVSKSAKHTKGEALLDILMNPDILGLSFGALCIRWNWSSKSVVHCFISYLINNDIIRNNENPLSDESRTIPERQSERLTVNYSDLLRIDDRTAIRTIPERLTACEVPDNSAFINQITELKKEIAELKEAAEKSKKKKSEKKEVPEWKKDYQVYLANLNEAYEKLINDKEYIAKLQSYDSRLNIPLTMKKAYESYWATHEGWERRKKSKTQILDWAATFINAISMQSNKVYQKNNDGELRFKFPDNGKVHPGAVKDPERDLEAEFFRNRKPQTL